MLYIGKVTQLEKATVVTLYDSKAAVRSINNHVVGVDESGEQIIFESPKLKSNWGTMVLKSGNPAIGAEVKTLKFGSVINEDTLQHSVEVV